MNKVKQILVKPRLAEVLKSKGITQLEASELSGIPQSAISRFDRQESHKDEHVASLIHAIGCTYNDLFQITIEYEE